MMRSSFASKRCQAPQEKVILKVTNLEDQWKDVYKIGIHVHLKKLMLDYCQRRNLDYKILRFIYNGILLRPRQTPAQLMMENDDIIDTVIEQASSAGPNDAEKVILKVTNLEDQRKDVYKIGVHAHFKKLMLHYCQKKNLDCTTLRFVFNGSLLRPRQTPAQLMMEDGDVIDTVMEQASSAGPSDAV